MRATAEKMNEVLEKAKKDGRGAVTFQIDDYEKLCKMVNFVAMFCETMEVWEIKKEKGDKT